jgi:hypothetical protein
MDQEKNSCYLCQMFKTIFIFTFGVMVGLIGAVILGTLR